MGSTPQNHNSDQALAARVAHCLHEAGLTLATAESCTGGGISALLTSLAGSSNWFNGAIVSYSNEAKTNLLKVPQQLIQTHGAVSEEVVVQMSIGGCRALAADACIAVSGIAGPTGAAPGKPIGTVWIAWCCQGETKAARYQIPGAREEVQATAVKLALEGLMSSFFSN